MNTQLWSSVTNEQTPFGVAGRRAHVRGPAEPDRVAVRERQIHARRAVGRGESNLAAKC